MKSKKDKKVLDVCEQERVNKNQLQLFIQFSQFFAFLSKINEKKNNSVTILNAAIEPFNVPN